MESEGLVDNAQDSMANPVVLVHEKQRQDINTNDLNLEDVNVKPGGSKSERGKKNMSSLENDGLDPKMKPMDLSEKGQDVTLNDTTPVDSNTMPEGLSDDAKQRQEMAGKTQKEDEAAIKSTSDAHQKDGAEFKVERVHPLFGRSIGKVVGEYTGVQHCNCHGKFFAGTKAICFYSANFFGFEQSRVVLPLRDVSGIRHVGEDSINIITEAGKKHTFKGFGGTRTRDAVFEVLVNLHGSDSLFKSITISLPPPTEEVSQGNMTVRTSMAKRRSMMAVTAQVIEDRDTELSEADYLSAFCAAAMADFSKSQKRLTAEIEEGDSSEQETTRADENGGTVPDDMLKAWTELLHSKQPSFNEIVLKDVVLPCELDTFVDMFLSDNAEFSIASYQRDVIGDKGIKTSPWKLSPDDGFSLTRTIEYSHPVNVPMAPPTAEAVKEQCFRRFGHHGMVLETHTTVKDVPMTDCFFVDDRVLIEPRPEGGISLTAQFEARFIKRTIFRSIITSTTNAEVRKYFMGYDTAITDALKKKKAVKLALEEKCVEVILPPKEKAPEEQLMEKTLVTKKRDIVPEIVIKPRENNVAQVRKMVEENIILVLVLFAVCIIVFVQVKLMGKFRVMNESFVELNRKQEKMLEMFGQAFESKINDAYE